MENRITEQASAYDNLQRMSVHDILTGINREDARVHEAVAKTIPVMERLVERVVERMERGGRMFYIGAGTSGRLGVTDASELPPTYGVPFDRVIGLIAGGDGALRRAVENAEDDTAGAWRDMAPYHPTADDVLVGIAASGTTPYVVGGLRMAREHGLLTASITCNPSSPVAVKVCAFEVLEHCRGRVAWVDGAWSDLLDLFARNATPGITCRLRRLQENNC